MRSTLFIVVFVLAAVVGWQSATIHRQREEIAESQQFQSQALGLVGVACHRFADEKAMRINAERLLLVEWRKGGTR